MSVVSKEKKEIVNLKQDANIFCKLYVACQTREGDVHSFFLMRTINIRLPFPNLDI